MNKFLGQIDLSAIISMEDIQKIQDNFSRLAEIPFIICYLDGSVPEQTDIYKYCKYILSSKKSQKECNLCKNNIIKECLNKDEVCTCSCNFGLAHFAVPFKLMSKTIGVILIATIVKDDEDNNIDLKKLAKKYDLNETILEKYYKEIKVLSKERLTDIVKSLYSIANILSRMAFTNHLLITKSKQEIFIRELASLANKVFDSEKILSLLCENVAKFFDIDSVSIFEKKKLENNKVNMLAAYKLRPDIQTVKEILERENRPYSDIIKEWRKAEPVSNKYLLFNSIEEAPFEKWAKDTYKKAGVKNLLIETVENSDETYKGILLSSYTEKLWTMDELILLEEVTKYVSVILQNSDNLAEISHQKKQREIVLDNIPFGAWIKDTKTQKYIC